MSKDRRTFMIATGLAAGGALVGSLNAATITPSTAEGEVDQIVSKYGSTLKASKDAKGVTHLQVKLTNHGRLRDIMTAKDCPFGAVMATSRNTLDFSHRGQQFSVSHSA